MSMVDDTARTDLSLFDRLGGAPAIAHLVEAFYRRMDTLPEAAAIRAMHGPDLAPIREVLRRYLTEWTGGPALYSPEKGHPRLRSRHVAFPIGEEERDAWLLCMHGALEEAVADDEARAEVFGNMVKLADWMRNRAGNPHDPRRTAR